MAVAVAVPSARTRARILRGEVEQAGHAAPQLASLQAVVRRDGGAATIRACGQPVAALGYQSELAWVLGVNVSQVDYLPWRGGGPAVVFEPHGQDWQVRLTGVSAGRGARCGGPLTR